MTFNETLVFLGCFAVLYNVNDYFRLRWLVLAKRRRGKRYGKYFDSFLSVLALVFLCAGFVSYTCYYAIHGFIAAYHDSVSTALAMILYLVCYDFLVRGLIRSIAAFRQFRHATGKSMGSV